MKKTDLRPSQGITLPNGKLGYFRDAVTPGFRVSDPDYVKWATSRLSQIPEFAAQTDLMKKVEAKLAGFGSFAAPKRFPISMGMSLGPQQEMIGARIFRKFASGPDEQGYYPKYGKEGFFVDPKGSNITLGQDVRRMDVKIEFGTVKTKIKGREVLTENREQDLASAVLNLNLEAYKLDRAQASLAAEEENDYATIALDSTQYETGYSKTLTAGEQWSHKDSKPVEEFWQRRRQLFLANLVDPDLFAMGGDTEATLMTNAQILNFANIAKTGTGRAVPVTRDFLAALFQIEIAVGNAAMTQDLDSTDDPTQIWGDFAGLYCTGPTAIVAPRFGISCYREGYPDLLPYRDDRVGTGANVLKWMDSWNPIVLSNKAGFLWEDTKL